ncbi:MAG: leucine-rich repeat domain-containing protein [bacterium]|nr:leucine-rich repeat domain-containing protein [bacterium]
MRSPADAGLQCNHSARLALHTPGAPLTLLRNLLLFLLPFVTACDSGPGTFADVERGRVYAVRDDVDALREFLSAAGLAPLQLGVEGELAGDSPNWIEIDAEGRVWAVGLSAAPGLDDLAPLGKLSALARVRIRGASLENLEGLAHASSLTHLTVVGSGLRSLAGLEGSSSLRLLDLRDNEIESLAGLADLPELRILDLAGNAIVRVEGVEGRERLESLDLSGNSLDTIEGIERLPNLERLNLARNRLVSLDGLRELPRLRELLVDDNQLTDASAVDALPSLELVNLNGNRLDRFPRLVSQIPEHLWQANPGTRRVQAEEVEARSRR